MRGSNSQPKKTFEHSPKVSTHEVYIAFTNSNIEPWHFEQNMSNIDVNICSNVNKSI